MQKVLIDLPFQGGVYTEQSARGAKPFWKDSDKIRFRNGLPEKLGGWRSVSGTFKGMARKFLDWASLDGQIWVAIATESKLYLWQNDTMYDITPLRETGTLTAPFATTSGSAIVVVTDANHGAQRGDYVRFTGATAVGGITITGEYQIDEILTIDTYKITHTSNAGSTTTGGGTVAYEYDISVGRGTTSYGTGWGTGAWGASTWNTARAVTSTVFAARTWALENWGEDLIASPRGGAIYWWDKTSGASTRATVLSGSPDRANFLIMNDQSRQLLAFGATDDITGQFDPLLLRWCSSEDFNDWTVTEGNTAGDARVYQGSKFITAARTRSEIIAFTDKSIHSVRQIGAGEFSVNLVGPNIAILGPNAVATVGNKVYFMADGDFYVYDGLPRPMPCSVRNYVFENLNTFQKDKVHVGVNTQFGEIWFFYPGKTPDVWVDADFASGALSDDFGQQAMNVGASHDYIMGFNALGYISLSNGMTSAQYTATYMLKSSLVIVDPSQVEYETTFKIAALTTTRFGLIFGATDLSGSANVVSDDVKGLLVTLDSQNSMIYLERRGGSYVSGTWTNAAASYATTALATPITITVGRRYGILVKYEASFARVYFWDENSGTTQLVASLVTDGTEQADYSGALAGIVGQVFNTTPVLNSTLFESFRAGKPGSIVDQTQRGATREINRYAVFNYLEELWAIGSLTRTAWADTSKAYDLPYAAGTNGKIYTHEDGVDDDVSAMTAYLESHDSEIPPAGQDIMQMDQIIPDFLRLSGSVTMKLRSKKYPQETTYASEQSVIVDPTSRMVSVRIRGRQVCLRITSSAIGDYWRYGTMRARIFAHGQRGNV